MCVCDRNTVGVLAQGGDRMFDAECVSLTNLLSQCSTQQLLPSTAVEYLVDGMLRTRVCFRMVLRQQLGANEVYSGASPVNSLMNVWC